MAATLTQERFTAPEWLFERKLDGIRLLAFKQGSDVRLFSRNRLPQTIPSVAAAIASLPVDDAIFDGEATWDRTSGYHLFDVLWIDGLDVRRVPLRSRKRLLRDCIGFADPVRLTPYRNERGEELFAAACMKGWEGLIAKRASSAYTARRSRDWLKFKCDQGQELVIAGYTDPQGARSRFGALLLGYYEGDELRYAGRVGTGFDDATLESLGRRLDALGVPASPFADPGSVDVKAPHWVEPALVAQIGFTEWTRHGRLRHPRFLGLRDDKSASEVVREQ